MTDETLLQTRSLTKEFRGFRAVSDVDLVVQTGTVHALVGPNGAGKTTLFNLLTGFLEPSSGTIEYDGHDITASARKTSHTWASPGRSRSPASSTRSPSGSTSSWRSPAAPGSGCGSGSR
jgi:ABC-type branched-subunit amino acid transport system ATPase component